MATFSLSCTLDLRTSLSTKMIPVPSNQIAVNFDLSVNTIYGEGSIEKTPASVVPKPVNSIEVLGELARMYVNGIGTAEIVGPVINVPNLSNSIAVDFDLKRIRASGVTEISTGDATLIPKPVNSIAVTTEIVGIKIGIVISAESRAHHNPLPFKLSGSAESGGLVDAKMNYVTRLHCPIDSSGTIENMYINHNIALSGSAVSGGDIAQTITGHLTKLYGMASASGRILAENSSRLVLTGSAKAGGSVKFVRGLVTSLHGRAQSNFVGTVYWDHIYKTPIDLKIWVERTREFPIDITVALEREERAPIDLDIPIVRTFPMKVVYSKAKTLGNFHYPYNPPRGNFTGVRGDKVNTSMNTKGGHIKVISKPILTESRIVELWEYMDKYFFMELLKLYEANDGKNLYWYRVNGDPASYQVEIVSLEGVPYKDKYYRNVRLELKPYVKSEI